jgi:hypothetical protein
MKSKEECREILKVIKAKKDHDGLWYFIDEILGIKIPRINVCPDHDAPFDFVCAAFFEEYQNILVVANRSGGKTIDFSILDVLNSYLYDDCETATVGAIEAQAKKCYNYVHNWNQKEPISSDVVDSLMSKTHYTNGSTIEVLTGTMSGVNAPHPQRVFIDEIELMAWNVLQEAFSMAQSKKTDKGTILAQTILTSSRKFATGPMERLLREAKERNFKVFKWCIKEVIEKHDPEMCKVSIFHDDCQGDCEKCDGYYTFSDVISAKRRLDKDTWDSQWMCKKPMAHALVYPAFDITRHVKKIEFNTSSPLHLSEDFGFASGHANVVGFWQFGSGGKKTMIGEIWVEGKTDEEIILLVEQKIEELGFVPNGTFERMMEYKKHADPKETELRGIFNKAVSSWSCPPEEPSKISIRSNKGYSVVSQTDPEIRKVSYGIPIVRRDLEQDLLCIDISCVGTIAEMSAYSNIVMADGTIKDEPAKKFDNGPDMIRYMYLNHFPYIAQVSLSKSQSKEESNTITGGIMDVIF